MKRCQPSKTLLACQIRSMQRKRLTHLWWVLRTQGSAAIAVMTIVTHTNTPNAKTTTCSSRCARNTSTVRKISQMIPAIAQPEWMPPKCYNSPIGYPAVWHMRIWPVPEGWTCTSAGSVAASTGMRIINILWQGIEMVDQTHFCEASVHEEVQTTTKDLVPHKDTDVEVADGDGTAVLSSVMPVTGSCESEHYGIGDENDSKEFSGDA